MGRKKQRESECAPNPEVVALRDELELQMQSFLSSVGDRVSEYEANLNRLAQVSASEEQRKAAMRAANNSTTVITTKITATQSLLDKATEIVGAEKMAELKPQLVADEEKEAKDQGETTDTAGEEEEELAPHYVIELNMDRNVALIEELLLLRQATMRLAGVFDGITDWLALSLPVLNEENSVMTEVLGAVLEQIQSFVESLREIIKFPKKYLSDRAEIEKDLLKLPESKAIQMQLELHDAESWDDMEKSWKVLIRVSLIAQSVITKNLQTLKNESNGVAAATQAALYY